MYARGKLLLSGEYFVLDGALALAAPTHFGQKMQLKPLAKQPDTLLWTSLTTDGEAWFAGTWQRQGSQLQCTNTFDESTAERLTQLMEAIAAQRPAALDQLFGYHIQVQLEFVRNWGLGSSSTLVSLLAQQTATDPYQLLAATFGGSAYDIACATAKGPIFYQRRPEQQPMVTALEWSPAYREQVYFVYLGQKQNSREGIHHYRELGGVQAGLIDEASSLSSAFNAANTYLDIARVMRAHEAFIGGILQLEQVQPIRFPDFPGVVKSLGAWGGDFVMVLSPVTQAETAAYFRKKGCTTILTFDEMLFGV